MISSEKGFEGSSVGAEISSLLFGEDWSFFAGLLSLTGGGVLGTAMKAGLGVIASRMLCCVRRERERESQLDHILFSASMDAIFIQDEIFQILASQTPVTDFTSFVIHG